MGLASTDWLMAAGWRQGLFMHCIEEDAPQPLPFNMQQTTGCYQSRDVGTLLLLSLYFICLIVLFSLCVCVCVCVMYSS